MKKLFLRENPLVDAYPTQANLFATIPNKEYYLWFFENSLNLFAKDGAKSNYIDFFSPIPWKMNPWIRAQQLSYFKISKDCRRFSDFLINAINQNLYILTYIDRAFINEMTEYTSKEKVAKLQDGRFKKNLQIHETLVYGYDELNQVFFCTEFREKYKTILIDFENMNNSFLSLLENDIDDYAFFSHLPYITLIEYKKPLWYKCNVNKICNQIDDFINAKTSFQGYSGGIHALYEIEKDKYIFGINVYDFLINHTQNIMATNNWDYRGFHAIYNHKKIMREMLMFLAKEYCIDMRFINTWEEILQLSRRCEMAYIKMSLNKKNDYTKMIIDDIDIMRKKEKQLLASLLENIKTIA